MEGKKRILISTQLIAIGGVERSLIGLLDTIDYQKFEVDVFIFNHDGELRKYLNPKVNLLKEDKEYSALFKPLKYCLQNLLIKVLVIKLLAKIRTKFKKVLINIPKDKYMNHYHTYLIYYASVFLKKVNPGITYDACISFLHPNFVETKNVNARQYLGWVHTDYCMLSLDVDMELKMWSMFDHIFAVSSDCVNRFTSIFPQLKNKVSVFENIFSTNFIIDQSNEFQVDHEINLNDGKINMLSIGRFSLSKNFDSIPEIAYHLKNKGLWFNWYIIGFGSGESLIRNKIKEWGVEDEVVILGKKINPYPYIKAIDVYIQPSRYEGKAVTVREAQALHKPVIITNYETAASQLENNVDGVIVPLENRQCAEAIYDIVTNDTFLEQLLNTCRKRNYSNKQEINKIEEILFE